MAQAEPADSAHALAQLRGSSYVSPWLLIDQPMVDAFAAATGDHQFIHVDARRAAKAPFGGTIAHGFLLLSILPQLHARSDRPEMPGIAMGINYGFDRVRFVSPVRTGARVRAHFMVAELTEIRPGEWQQALEVTLEVDGGDRPAVVAHWLSRFILDV